MQSLAYRQQPASAGRGVEQMPNSRLKIPTEDSSDLETRNALLRRRLTGRCTRPLKTRRDCDKAECQRRLYSGSARGVNRPHCRGGRKERRATTGRVHLKLRGPDARLTGHVVPRETRDAYASAARLLMEPACRLESRKDRVPAHPQHPVPMRHQPLPEGTGQLSRRGHKPKVLGKPEPMPTEPETGRQRAWSDEHEEEPPTATLFQADGEFSLNLLFAERAVARFMKFRQAMRRMKSPTKEKI